MTTISLTIEGDVPLRLENYQKGMALGQSAYLDTNYIISVLDIVINRPIQPKEVFAELLRQKVMLLVSSLTINEAWWTLLREWNREDGHKDIRNKLKEKPETYLQPYLPRLRTFIEKIGAWPHLTWIGPGSIDSLQIQSSVHTALDYIGKFNLMPSDAFHLQYATAGAADTFITSDPDFAALVGIADDIDLLIVQTT